MAERIPFRGEGLTCSCVVESLPWVELDMVAKGVIQESIDIFQLGYRDDVGASKGTHDEGGCTDVAQFGAEAIEVWRLWGWTMQDRSPFFALDHGHGWPYHCSHLAKDAQDQQQDWDNRKNGLISNGPVQGRWPVLPWKTALAKEKPRVLTDIADAVLKRDGQIENLWKDRDPGAGDFVSLKTALGHLARDNREQKKQLAAIVTALGKLQTAAKP